MLKKILTAMICLALVGCTILICVHIKPERTPGNILGNAIDGAIEDVTSFSSSAVEQIRETAEGIFGGR